MSNGLPRIWSYGEYSSSNYGAHCLAVDVGPVRDKDNGRVDGETFERLWKEQVEPRLNGEELQPVADPDSPWSLGLLE